MPSGKAKAKADRIDPDRSRLYRELLRKNKRGFPIAGLLGANRERRQRIERVMQAQRERFRRTD